MPTLLQADWKKMTSLPEHDERERRIALAERAISIYSPSGDEKVFAEFLKSELQDHGLKPKIDSAGNVICEIGSGNISLLLCGHMDTVPGKLSVKIKDNFLYGRGACDAKGALLSMLFAFEDIALEFQRDPSKEKLGKIIFAGVTEEERESVGLMELIKNGVRADAAIFGEPCGVEKVTIGYRGHVTVNVEIETKEVHGSAPWLSINAAEVAFSLYKRAKEQWPCEKPESTDCVSVALTKIHSGDVHNVIPGRAGMTLDIRIPAGIHVGEVMSKIQSLASSFGSKEVSVSVGFGEPTEPYRTPLNSTLVRAINRSLIKSGFSRSSFVTKSGTGDMNTYALSFGADAVTYGPGDTKLSHTNEERVDLEEIFACSKILGASAFELFALYERNQ